MSDGTEKYAAYIRSTDWRITRGIAKARAGYRCESCGAEGRLQVHHLTYERLGHEWPTDIIVLCGDCHVATHKEIDRARETRSMQRRYAAGLDTYMTKKYGDDWDSLTDPFEAEEEFDEWLERTERGEEP